MTFTEENWLDSLVKHSIFDLSEEEKVSVDHLTHQQTRQQHDNNIVDYVLQHHNRVITCRDNDLFVGVGCQIRVLNLTELKDAWLEASKQVNQTQAVKCDNWIHTVPYKVLETPELTFTIESMAANKNGKLLSVAGQSKLIIVCLPRQGFSDVSDSSNSRKKVDCRTLSVGSPYYDKSNSEILKVQWHPLSETGTHIVVLGNDNILRIFDISIDIEEPEQFFDLSPADKTIVEKGRGYSFNNDEDDGEEDAVTFSLGGPSQDQSGWETFTVFYALRSGHIYALCPVIPYRSVIRRNHLDNLACISQVKYEQCKSNYKTLSFLFKLHSEWINVLFESAKVGHGKLDNDTLTVVSTDNHVYYPVQRQGPFLINHTQPLDNGVQTSDLLYLNADPVNVLALALTNGTVQNYILASEIDAQWQMPVKNAKDGWQKELGILLTDSDFLPRATLYESINLHSSHLPPFQRVTLLNDPLYPDTYYAYHAGGVHAIDMHSWVYKLGKLISNHEKSQNADAERGLKDWLNEKKTSDFRLLVDTSPFSTGYIPIIGLVLISDIYLSYSVLAITSDYRLTTCELNMRRGLIASEASTTAVKQQLKSLESESGYQPLLPLPAFQPPKQLDSLPKQTKVVIPSDMAGKVVINEDTLRFFHKTSEQVRRDTHDLKKAAIKIDGRLTLQQKEFERQVVFLRELYDRLQRVRSDEAKSTQEQKLKDLTATHAKLRLRIDEQLRKLMNTYQPDLSNEEKEWIAKLEKLSKQIGGDSGYSARIKMLQEQVQQLSLKADKPKPKTSNINATQLNNVLRTLKEQTTSIEEAKERVESLSNKLPTPVA
ncbi:unnamed protein product [Mucor hiemalis]